MGRRIRFLNGRLKNNVFTRILIWVKLLLNMTIN